jgi:hypothetical protein
MKQKIEDFISCPAMAAALRGGATAMMAARGGRSGLKAVDNEGGGRSMGVGAFYVGNDDRLRGGADTTIK